MKNIRKRLGKIFNYIYDFLDIAGNFPKYGDEDDGKCLLFDPEESFNNFRSLLTSGALIFADPRLKSKSNGIDLKNNVLFGNNAIADFNRIESISPDQDPHFTLMKAILFSENQMAAKRFTCILMPHHSDTFQLLHMAMPMLYPSYFI